MPVEASGRDEVLVGRIRPDLSDPTGRSLVIFLVYAVILATLLGQGLTLPWLIRWAGVSNFGLDLLERCDALNQARDVVVDARTTYHQARVNLAAAQGTVREIR